MYIIDADQRGVTLVLSEGCAVRDVLTAIALANVACNVSPSFSRSATMLGEAEMGRYIRPDNLSLHMFYHHGIVCPLDVEVRGVVPHVYLRVVCFSTNLEQLMENAMNILQTIVSSNVFFRDAAAQRRGERILS